MPRYRQGSKVPLNVYDGDEPIFQAHDAASAMKLAGLLNMGWHLTQVTYDQLQDVFAESERYWGEEDFLTRLQSEVWMLLMPKNVVVSAPDTPPGSPVSEIEPGEPQDTAESREGHTGLVIQEEASFRASESSARLLRHSDGLVYERVGDRCGFSYEHAPCNSCYRVYA